MGAMSSWIEEVGQNGHAIIDQVIRDEQVHELRGLLSEVIPDDRRAGTRTLLSVQQVRELAMSDTVLGIMQQILGDSAKPVRAILFDKQPGANWNLAYHQDRAIAVKERKNTEGFIGWSIKEGVPHVLPPASVLEQMLTIRLHLDDCPPENAPLRVSPGSHKFGLIEQCDIPEIVAAEGEVSCTCRAGDALLMRPLLLHASSASESPTHRRVVHIEYSGTELPDGLEWYE